MKYILLVILLTGCDNQVNSFVNGRILKDKNGCAFLATDFSESSRIRLTYNRDESLPTCDYKEKKECTY